MRLYLLAALLLTSCLPASAEALVDVTITGTRHFGERPIATTFSFDTSQLLAGKH